MSNYMENVTGSYIIAEAGVNHNGSLDLAYRMIDTAKEAGCDCIKFQTFRTESLVTGTAEMAQYQKDNLGSEAGSQYQMLKKLELTPDAFARLKEYCDSSGIQFLSTPFDKESVDLLESLEIDFYKMSSGDITNKPLLQYVAKKKKPLILSTGMCTMAEVKEAVAWVEETGNTDIKLLHCTSNYPTPYEEVNMNAMLTMKKEFPYDIGYSDHTQGIIIPVMAAALGAAVIEKHFTLDKTMEGPDHKASLDPTELKEMVKAIRGIESARGDGIKLPSASEENTSRAARKSIVLKETVRKGQTLRPEYLTVKRPGTGIAPKYLEDVMGRILNKDKLAEELLYWEDMEDAQ